MHIICSNYLTTKQPRKNSANRHPVDYFVCGCYTGSITSTKDKEMIAYINAIWKRIDEWCEKYLSANKEHQ